MPHLASTLEISKVDPFLRHYALQKQGVVLYVPAAADPCPNYAQRRPNYVSTMFQLWLNYVSIMVKL